MAFIGTESAGYRITMDEDGRLVIESWGFWSAELATAFEFEAVAACRRSSTLQCCEWNAADLKPQAEHGRAAIRNLMALLSNMNVSDCQNVADNALTLMQLRRLARECGLTLVNIRDSWT